jgi:hypothetical protein
MDNNEIKKGIEKLNIEIKSLEALEKTLRDKLNEVSELGANALLKKQRLLVIKLGFVKGVKVLYREAPSIITGKSNSYSIEIHNKIDGYVNIYFEDVLYKNVLTIIK